MYLFYSLLKWFYLICYTWDVLLVKLWAKLYIFRVSKSNHILNYPSFCTFLKRIYLEQEYAAKLEFKEGNFSKIWGNFMPIFSG